MKLEKFELKDRKKTIIIGVIVTIILILSVIYLFNSFALYEENKSFDVINGTVTNPGDLYFAFYVDGVISKNMPSRDSGYLLNEEKSSCTNEATPMLDTETWQIKVLNMKSMHTKCTLYFEHYDLVTSVITSLVEDADKTSSGVYTVPDKTNETCTYTLAYDGTSDNNLRYVGANPCNYVDIDGEKWRIIGLMNNVEDENGLKATHIKLIRNESIGAYSWDISDISINDGYGVNEWSTSYIEKLLNPNTSNGLYWSGTSGSCPKQNGPNQEYAPCDFSNANIKDTLKKMIEKVTFYTGSNTLEHATNILTKEFYENERSTNTGKNCNVASIFCTDTTTRTTTWKGLVGLLNISDYGYATGDNDRANCLQLTLNSWDSNQSCALNNYLYKNKYTWSLNPINSQSNADLIFRISSNGSVEEGYYNSISGNTFEIYPVVFLKTDIKIISGDGSLDNSYKLAL